MSPTNQGLRTDFSNGVTKFFGLQDIGDGYRCETGIITDLWTFGVTTGEGN
jgi:hypothetical protein